MSQLRQRESELSSLNVRVAVITFEAGPTAVAYVCETGLGWPLLVDRERLLYRAYGMERGNWWSIFGPSSWWAYIKLMGRGGCIRKPTGDTRQLGGDVLIDSEGIVRLHHVSSGPADRPTPESLLEIVRNQP